MVISPPLKVKKMHHLKYPPENINHPDNSEIPPRTKINDLPENKIPNGVKFTSNVETGCCIVPHLSCFFGKNKIPGISALV